MAVENLYNTAVEYHSPLAAEPPPPMHKPGPFLQGPVAQTHVITASSPLEAGLTRAQQRPECCIWKIQAVLLLLLL